MVTLLQVALSTKKSRLHAMIPFIFPLLIGPSVKIWDLEGKIIVDELKPEVLSTSSKAEPPQCISLAWSSDGQTLFAGYTDNIIRVWQVTLTARI